MKIIGRAFDTDFEIYFDPNRVLHKGGLTYVNPRGELHLTTERSRALMSKLSKDGKILDRSVFPKGERLVIGEARVLEIKHRISMDPSYSLCVRMANRNFPYGPFGDFLKLGEGVDLDIFLSDKLNNLERYIESVLRSFDDDSVDLSYLNYIIENLNEDETQVPKEFRFLNKVYLLSNGTKGAIVPARSSPSYFLDKINRNGIRNNHWFEN